MDSKYVIVVFMYTFLMLSTFKNDYCLYNTF